MTLPLSEINYINAEIGNKGLSYAIKGALGGVALISIIIATAYRSDPYLHYHDLQPYVDYGYGLIGLSFVIGYVWGLNTPVEKIIYRDGEYLANYGSLNYQRSPISNNYIFSVRINL